MNKNDYEVIDVRNVTTTFLPGLLKKASKVEVGKGLCIIQSFDPKPLYSALEDLGYQWEVEKISDDEYRCYFLRVEIKDLKFENGSDMPFKPTAILNYKKIDNDLAITAVDFWQLIWEKENSAIDLKTKLLLSLSNAVGASRFRQATRELVKAYSIGLSVAELDELFSLFAWNQGIGFFSSEIGPSPLFKAYQLIKTCEKQGKSRKVIMKELLLKFGDKNKEVNTNTSINE
jgi:uncharacterized protein (DUF2249 family)